MFRTSDAAWIGKLVLSGFTATPENPQLHRTALGAQDTVPWTYVKDPADLLIELRAAGTTIAALELTDTPTYIADITPQQFPLALILGNELKGVPDHLLALCDYALEIPQYGTKQSFNVSVAYGIAIMNLVESFRAGSA